MQKKCMFAMPNARRPSTRAHVSTGPGAGHAYRARLCASHTMKLTDCSQTIQQWSMTVSRLAGCRLNGVIRTFSLLFKRRERKKEKIKEKASFSFSWVASSPESSTSTKAFNFQIQIINQGSNKMPRQFVMCA